MRRMVLAVTAVIGFGLVSGSAFADDWHRGGHHGGRGRHDGHRDHWDHHHHGRTVIQYRAPVYPVYDPYIYRPYVPYYPQSSFGVSTPGFSFFLSR